MKLCRFDDDRLGLVQGEFVRDVTPALEAIPARHWPHGPGDALIANLDAVAAAVHRIAPTAPRHPLGAVSLRSPVANPSKVMAAPANYRAHVAVDGRDPGVDHGVHLKQIEGMEAPTEKLGLFLKAVSSLAGPGDGLALGDPMRRHDHEVELTVIIGRRVRGISQADALSCVAGYCIGLDMTMRGTEDRSWRKSLDGYTLLGPWLTTADEIADPHRLDLELSVNGEMRQRSSTGDMTVRIERLIELAAATYTLHPGDVLMTGTPAGVGPVAAGDTIRAACSGIGGMTVLVTGRD